MKLNTPSVSISKKTNEENIQSLKSWAGDIVSTLTYHIDYLESEVQTLQDEINELKNQ